LKNYKYLLCLIVPILIISSLVSDTYFVFTPLVCFFFLVPIVELFFRPNNYNLSPDEEIEALSSKYYDILLYAFVPLQYLILGYFLYTIDQTIEPNILMGKVLCMGLACGVLGINVAHELGHRSTWYERLMSKGLLMTSLYMHFFIEHNLGHHKNVATHHDPASAREGESIYSFYPRSIILGWLSAWRIQKHILERKSKSFFSKENQMLIFCFVQFLFIYFIFFFFGGKTTFCFLISALIGILLLETVNYIEHYGLRRKIKVNDEYERTLPAHSWNSNHPIGRILLLELSRHSDHHYMTSRKYPILRHFEDSPQMPTGYPGMMLLSLVPPLWFFVIHKILKNYKKQVFGSALG